MVRGLSREEKHVRSPNSGLVFKLTLLLFVSLILLGGKWIELARTNNLEEKAKPFLEKYYGSNPLPVAWLMSFPNSGTSYTSYLVRTVTGQRTASNYRSENLGSDGASAAVFEDSPSGPFWSDINSPEYGPLTSGYLLTKTHCGGYCDQCPPLKYIENATTFAQSCREGDHIGWGGSKEVLDSYSGDLVERAIHLIRDPFDNIVSRFHLTQKYFVKAKQHENVAKYPKSREGFRAFCKDMGERFYKEEKAVGVFDDMNIPCHADFFRYIQWHNLAFATTQALNIPTMIIHYEDYTKNFDQTKDMLLRFLDLSGTKEPPLFETGKTYREYFTEEEIQAVSRMFSLLAHNETWDHTNHYLFCGGDEDTAVPTY